MDAALRTPVVSARDFQGDDDQAGAGKPSSPLHLHELTRRPFDVRQPSTQDNCVGVQNIDDGGDGAREAVVKLVHRLACLSVTVASSEGQVRAGDI